MLLLLWKLTQELFGLMGGRVTMLIFKANGAASAGASPLLLGQPTNGNVRKYPVAPVSGV